MRRAQGRFRDGRDLNFPGARVSNALHTVRFRARPAHVLDQPDASLPDRHAQHGGPVLREDPDVRLRAQRPGRARPGGESPDRHDACRRCSSGSSLTLRDGERADAPVYFGGPVQTDRGFVLHAPAGNWQSTLRVGDARRPHHLEGHPRGGGPRRGPAAAPGHARLRRLVAGPARARAAQNAWLTVEARDGILFDTPAEERLPAAMELLGLDFARLQDEAGHA